MAKEKRRVELRHVDEDEKEASRLIRLHKNAVEVVEEIPAVRVGEMLVPEARLEAATRDELKTRSSEPGVGSLIERDAEILEELWEVPAPKGRIPWGWLALVACAFAGGILWSLMEVNQSKEKQQGLVLETKSILEKELEADLEAEKMIESIQLAITNFYDSRSVEELLRYVRHPERVKPLMEKYYGDKPMHPSSLLNVIAMDPLTIDNRATFWLIQCVLEGGDVKQLLVEAESGTVVKVDWETYVCYQPMDWDEFAKNRTEGFVGDFRVYVELDNFYSHQFSDSEVYASFRLTAMTGEQVLFGYVNRQSMLAKNLEQLIAANNGAATPMILRLRVPEAGGSKRGVFAEKLISSRWAFVESPEAEE